MSLQPSVSAGVVSVPGVRYAEFWRRLVAYLIDFVLVGIVQTTLFVGVALMGPGVVPIDPHDPVYSAAQDISNMLGVVGVCWAFAWAYYAILESSPARATVGKYAMGVYVGDVRGDPISFPRASFRFWFKALSSLPLGAGWMIAAFTPRKQALHDFLAGTTVLRKVTYLADIAEATRGAAEVWDGQRWVASRVSDEARQWR